MKYCNRCKTEKPLEEFYLRTLRSKGIGRAPKCKKCSKELNAIYHVKNKAIRNARSLSRDKNLLKENRVKVLNYLIEHGCADCGEKDPVVLEFDHVRDKKFTISRRISISWDILKKEIDKCVIRCANCHRRKTAQERKWYSYISYDEQGKAYWNK